MADVAPEVLHEIMFFAVSVLFGIGLALGYDVILILRSVVPHNIMMRFAENLIYLIMTGIATFVIVEDWNGGVVRGYFLAGVMLTVLCYKKIMQQHLVVVMSTGIQKTIYLVKKPVKWLGKAVFKPFKKFILFCKTRLTVCIKVFRIRLCKHCKGER